MSSLFKKLNTLLNAQLHDLVGSQGRPPTLPMQHLGPDMDAQIAGLRARLDAARAYQDDLQARVDALYAEVASWDTRADQALSDGRQDEARYALERLQFTQRNLNMADADLREHQTITEDLLSQINALEAIVEQSRRQPQTSEPPPVSAGDQVDNTIGKVLSDILHATQTRVQESVTAVRDLAAEDDANTPLDSAAVDDELDRRLNRLRKPSSDE